MTRSCVEGLKKVQEALFVDRQSVAVKAEFRGQWMTKDGQVTSGID